MFSHRSTKPIPIAALAMLDTFASVGVRSFDVTLTDIEGKKQRYEPNRNLDELRRTIGRRLEGAEGLRLNFIIRPRPTGLALIQLDDLDQAKADRLAPHAFLVFRTSPGNFQAWIAVKDPPTGFHLAAETRGRGRPHGQRRNADRRQSEFQDQIRAELSPGDDHPHRRRQGGDRGGARAGGFRGPTRGGPPPRVFPKVKTRPAQPAAGRRWPDYEQTLRGAPLKNDGSGPDRSRADFMWCKWALERGWGVEETAARLTEVSTKAQERIRVKEDAGYPLLTARNAAAAVERERGRRQAIRSPLRLG